MDVEVFSLLPQGQRKGCNLACQGEAHQGGLDAFGERALVKLLERSGLYTGPGGRAFEQTFQIMVVVLVQAANGRLFLKVCAFYSPFLLSMSSIKRDVKKKVLPRPELRCDSRYPAHCPSASLH